MVGERWAKPHWPGPFIILSLGGREGKIKTTTTHVEAGRWITSDRGSIPRASTNVWEKPAFEDESRLFNYWTAFWSWILSFNDSNLFKEIQLSTFLCHHPEEDVSNYLSIINYFSSNDNINFPQIHPVMIPAYNTIPFIILLTMFWEKMTIS